MISEFLVLSLYSFSHSSSFSSCTISWSKPNYFRFFDSFCSVLIPRRLLAILAYEYFGLSKSFSCRSWYRCIFGGEFIGVGFLCTFCFSYLLAWRYSSNSSDVFPEWDVSLGVGIIGLKSCLTAVLDENGILSNLSFCLKLISESRLTRDIRAGSISLSIFINSTNFWRLIYLWPSAIFLNFYMRTYFVSMSLMIP